MCDLWYLFLWLVACSFAQLENVAMCLLGIPTSPMFKDVFTALWKRLGLTDESLILQLLKYLDNQYNIQDFLYITVTAKI